MLHRLRLQPPGDPSRNEENNNAEQHGQRKETRSSLHAARHPTEVRIPNNCESQANARLRHDGDLKDSPRPSSAEVEAQGGRNFYQPEHAAYERRSPKAARQIRPQKLA